MRSHAALAGLVWSQKMRLSKISRPSALPSNGLAGALGVGHQAGHVARFVAYAGDVLQGTVGVGLVGRFAVGVDVLPEDLMAGLELSRVASSAK